MNVCASEESLIPGFISDYFYSLPSQGNIYTLVPLRNEDGSCKFLVSTLQRKILCLEYSNGNYYLYEVLSSSVPVGADIISMDAFQTPGKTGTFSVAVSCCKKEGAEITEGYLNIFRNWDSSSSCKDVDGSATSCIKLNYLPYHLSHTYLPSDVEKSYPVWLLCGSDGAVHIFSPSGQGLYEEISALENGFPEFEKITDIILRLDIYYLHDMKSRLTATCGERGNVSIYFVDLSDCDSPLVKSSRQLCFDFPVASSKFFDRYNHIDYILQTSEEIADIKQPDKLHESVYTVIAATLESCFVYRDIAADESGYSLPQSGCYDVVTCCIVCDINFDGVNEILVGTYGQTVLVYEEKEKNEESSWTLCQTLSLSSPVLSLAYEDFLGDGINELIVHTMAGVHVYQHDPQDMKSLLLRRLRSLSEKVTVPV